MGESNEVLLFDECQGREEFSDGIIAIEAIVPLALGILDGADLVDTHLRQLLPRLALAPTLLSCLLTLYRHVLQLRKRILLLYLLVNLQILILQVLNSLDTFQL